MLYTRLLGTLKFTYEFYIFCRLFEITPVLTIIVFFIANIVGLIKFFKCCFDVIFNMNFKNYKLVLLYFNYKGLYIIYIFYFYIIYNYY